MQSTSDDKLHSFEDVNAYLYRTFNITQRPGGPPPDEEESIMPMSRGQLLLELGLLRREQAILAEENVALRNQAAADAVTHQQLRFTLAHQKTLLVRAEADKVQRQTLLEELNQRLSSYESQQSSSAPLSKKARRAR